MRNKLLLSTLTAIPVLLEAVSMSAQERTVSGTVSDRSGPVFGAAVYVEGTAKGTTTGEDGGFSIQVPDSSTIVISCLGYDTQSIPVRNRTQINVFLQ